MQTFRVLVVLMFIGACILAYGIWGRAGNPASLPPAEPPHAIAVTPVATMQPVKIIELEYHQPDLPPGPGRDEFAKQCVVCHSPRYVVDQPIFPRKTWTSEVQKMVKAYGAMITPDEQKEIVNYLVYWHGKEDASAAPALQKQIVRPKERQPSN
jgi:sulfite dehydrogenase (cytochrome) subunit B